MAACIFPCNLACRAGCTATTGCFDESAKVHTQDGERTMKQLSKSLMRASIKAEKAVVDEVKISTVRTGGKKGKRGVLSYERLLAVEKLTGDFTFNEITVVSEDGVTVMLNTTDDHSWITMREQGACMKESRDIMVGDEVLVASGHAHLVPATVTATSSWTGDTKYRPITASGVALVNDLFISTICDRDTQGDCNAETFVNLEKRLEQVRRSEEAGLAKLEMHGFSFKVSNAVAKAIQTRAGPGVKMSKIRKDVREAIKGVEASIAASDEEDEYEAKMDRMMDSHELDDMLDMY